MANRIKINEETKVEITKDCVRLHQMHWDGSHYKTITLSKEDYKKIEEIVKVN